MKAISRVVIATVGMTGLVVGAAPADTKAPDAKPAAAAPKPADTKAPDAKPAAAAPKLVDAAPKPADKPPAMPSMKPPAELAELAKASLGTWKCTGQGMDHTTKMASMSGTMKFKMSLDNWWLQGSFESNMGKEPFHLETFTTFDANSKKWKRVMVESGGGWSSGESAGIKDGKLDWELTSHSAMGDSMFRDHSELDPKAGTKMWGEFSIDKGKTWTKVYEMTCKK